MPEAKKNHLSHQHLERSTGNILIHFLPVFSLCASSFCFQMYGVKYIWHLLLFYLASSDENFALSVNFLTNMLFNGSKRF
jgi:hypothetical protein